MQIEAKLAKRTLTSKFKDLETISDVLLQLQPLKEAFPTLVRLLQIAMKTCVSFVQCESCFSALKCIKSYLWSITIERPVDLASLSTDHYISWHLSIEAVVNEFTSSDRNQRITFELVIAHPVHSDHECLFYCMNQYCVQRTCLFRASPTYMYSSIDYQDGPFNITSLHMYQQGSNPH